MTLLADRHAQLLEAYPRLRIADAARALGVSELDLVRLDPRTVPLRASPEGLLRGLAGVGDTLSLTRNPWCVHERHGAWSEPTFHGGGKVGLVVGPELDLRLFLDAWVHLVHAVVDNARGPLASFQVFDAAGRAVLKVYRTAASDAEAWHALRESLVDPAAPRGAVLPATPPKADAPDKSIDVTALREAWSAMRDTHDAHGLLRKHGVGRVQALRLLGDPWARKVDRRAAVNGVLQESAASGQPIMVFVGNPGCIQIHTGPVHEVSWRGDWLNVLDPRFNLHLDVGGVTSAWVVRKPTDDGPVHSLELFAADGTLVVQLFGARKPGRPEDPAWTDRLLAQLSTP